MKKYDFNKKKSAASSYYNFKKDEERQAQRLSGKYYRSKGAVKVCIMENGVRVGYDKNGDVVWSF